MSVKTGELRSTSGQTVSPKRRLWCNLIRETFYKASQGEGTSLLFFKTQGGHFSKLCGFLDLPEADIRDRVLAKGFNNLNQKRIYIKYRTTEEFK